MVLLHFHYICDYCFKDIPWYFCILIMFVITVLRIFHGTLHAHYICDYCFKDTPWYFCILIMFVITVLRISHGTFAFSLCL